MFLWFNGTTRAYPTSLLRSLDHTQLETHTHTHARLNSYEQAISSSQSRCLHNTQQQTNTNPSAGLESAIPAIKQFQPCALCRMATGIGFNG